MNMDMDLRDSIKAYRPDDVWQCIATLPRDYALYPGSCTSCLIATAMRRDLDRRIVLTYCPIPGDESGERRLYAYIGGEHSEYVALSAAITALSEAFDAREIEEWDEDAEEWVTTPILADDAVMLAERGDLPYWEG